MSNKKLVKAFVAGMSFPAIVLPVIYTLMYLNVRSVALQHALQFIPMYLPLVWGIANAINAKLQKDATGKKANHSLIVTGACLGFLVAVFGVFVANIPMKVFAHIQHGQYLPLIVLPVVYAILFRYVVKWFNKLVGV